MSNETKKLYAERDAMELDQIGGHYFKHVMAMTSESLHSKSDIAAELGWRDCQIEQLEQQLAESQSKLEKIAAENAGLHEFIEDDCWICDLDDEEYRDAVDYAPQTPATDAYLAEVRAQSHKEGAHFVANRMLAAWGAGFIDDTAKNAADIARMILTSTEFMAEAPEGDFDRSFADGVLEDIAAQLRQGGAE